jgi:hypothetical protein
MKKLVYFGRRYEIPVFQRRSIAHPPVSDSIPLFWCMEDYTLQPSSRKGEEEVSHINYNTARSLRSELSRNAVWKASLERPDDTYRDQDRNLPTATHFGATSNLLSSLTAYGTAIRLVT